ncbi:hypothetical protein HK096_000926 [Nowakowskiella sp. JEL0078]|nr:hypothetical protein HK096_000926 [Nowakowskiella sp. JEL0078]
MEFKKFSANTGSFCVGKLGCHEEIDNVDAFKDDVENIAELLEEKTLTLATSSFSAWKVALSNSGTSISRIDDEKEDA